MTDSDAAIVQTMKGGSKLLTYVVAIIVATATVLGGAYGVAKSEAQSAAHAAATEAVTSDVTRERMVIVAKYTIQAETGQTLGRLDERTAQLQTQLNRIEAALAAQNEQGRRP